MRAARCSERLSVLAQEISLAKVDLSITCIEANHGVLRRVDLEDAAAIERNIGKRRQRLMRIQLPEVETGRKRVNLNSRAKLGKHTPAIAADAPTDSRK